MKCGALVVNTAWGGLGDEAAGVEVFEAEPPGEDHPLLSLDQAVLTPHDAGLTGEGAKRMALRSVQNVLDFLAGKPDPSLVADAGATLGLKESAT